MYVSVALPSAVAGTTVSDILILAVDSSKPTATRKGAPTSAGADPSATNPTNVAKNASSSSSSQATTKGKIAAEVIGGVCIAALVLWIAHHFGYLPKTQKWTERQVRRAEAIELREIARADEALRAALKKQEEQKKKPISHLHTNGENQAHSNPGTGTDDHIVRGRAPASANERVLSTIGSSPGTSDLPSHYQGRPWD